MRDDERAIVGGVVPKIVGGYDGGVLRSVKAAFW